VRKSGLNRKADALATARGAVGGLYNRIRNRSRQERKKCDTNFTTKRPGGLGLGDYERGENTVNPKIKEGWSRIELGGWEGGREKMCSGEGTLGRCWKGRVSWSTYQKLPLGEGKKGDTTNSHVCNGFVFYGRERSGRGAWQWQQILGCEKRRRI